MAFKIAESLAARQPHVIYLKADTNASKQLTSDALKPYLHGAVNNVDVLSK
jgi:hypothetical protein